MNPKHENFIEILREQLQFPTYYVFKFIVKVEEKDEVIAIFDGQNNVQLHPSKNGNYVSVSCQMLVKTPEEVAAIYIQASQIKGVISL